jgi:hypothetical protein
MAKIVGPLMSLSASGTFAGTFAFRCGSVVCRKKPERKDPFDPDDLSFQQKLFQEAAAIWSRQLSPEVKKLWRQAVIVSMFKPECVITTLSFAAMSLLNPQAGILWTTRELAAAFGILYVHNAFSLDGYQAWMSVYLTTQGQAWADYPNPPPGWWNPFD